MDALLFFIALFGKIFEIVQLDIVCNIGIHIHVNSDDSHKGHIKALRIL